MGLHKSWYGFQDIVSGRENFPNWERFWTDYVQEEIQGGTRDDRLVMTMDEDNFALEGKAKGKKGQGEAKSSQKGKQGQGEAKSSQKGKNGQGEAQSNEKGKKKDLSEIKCFHCDEFGHYATKYPKQKKSIKDHVAASTKVDVYYVQFEKGFLLIACMAS